MSVWQSDEQLLAELRRRIREDDGTRYPLDHVVREIAEGSDDE